LAARDEGIDQGAVGFEADDAQRIGDESSTAR